MFRDPNPGRDWRTTWDVQHPWLRQPIDFDDAYVVFRRYLYQAHRPRRMPHCGSPPATPLHWSQWAEEMRWHWRASQYDEMRMADLAQQYETEVARHAAAALAMQRVGTLELEAIVRAQEVPDYHHGLVRPRDASAMAREGIELERALAGRPLALASAERVPGTLPEGGLWDDEEALGSLTREQREALRAIHDNLQAYRARVLTENNARVDEFNGPRP